MDSNGLGANLMAVVCAWCKKPMGAKVCAAEMAGKVSHSICPDCKASMLDEPNTLVRGGRLESEVPQLRCGPDLADAGSPAPSPSPATGVNAAPAAQAVGSQPRQDTGITAVGRAMPEASGHLSGGPGASSTFTRPLFWLVQGTDFARSIAWAKRQPNAVSEQIRRRLTA